jgi:hypothetical protein
MGAIVVSLDAILLIALVFVFVNMASLDFESDKRLWEVKVENEDADLFVLSHIPSPAPHPGPQALSTGPQSEQIPSTSPPWLYNLTPKSEQPVYTRTEKEFHKVSPNQVLNGCSDDTAGYKFRYRYVLAKQLV